MISSNTHSTRRNFPYTLIRRGQAPTFGSRQASLSGLGKKLGEEAWRLKDSSTTISEVMGIDGELTSRFTLSFVGHRHIDYYVLRIFIPLTVILLVSWATFYLRDFGKRIDVGGANLLVLVAFNFTISDNLPQLGYLTFLDAILVVTFVLTGLVIIVNVAFRRMEYTGSR